MSGARRSRSPARRPAAELPFDTLPQAALFSAVALACSDLLEPQFDESPPFGAIVDNAIATKESGFAAPDWIRPGLGIALQAGANATTEVSTSAGGSQL